MELVPFFFDFASDAELVPTFVAEREMFVPESVAVMDPCVAGVGSSEFVPVFNSTTFVAGAVGKALVALPPAANADGAWVALFSVSSAEAVGEFVTVLVSSLRSAKFSLVPAEGESAGVRGPILLLALRFVETLAAKFVVAAFNFFAVPEFVPETFGEAFVPLAVVETEFVPLPPAVAGALVSESSEGRAGIATLASGLMRNAVRTS